MSMKLKEYLGGGYTASKSNTYYVITKNSAMLEMKELYMYNNEKNIKKHTHKT